ncbi:MAG: hypothetical protein HFH63_09395 [Lachnospiraceae bacterium]|nr:hypothetical protein [Lachnospiraceae bacterium]
MFWPKTRLCGLSARRKWRAVEDAKCREAQEQNRELEVHIVDTYTKD